MTRNFLMISGQLPQVFLPLELSTRAPVLSHPMCGYLPLVRWQYCAPGGGPTLTSRVSNFIHFINNWKDITSVAILLWVTSCYMGQGTFPLLFRRYFTSFTRVVHHRHNFSNLQSASTIFHADSSFGGGRTARREAQQLCRAATQVKKKGGFWTVRWYGVFGMFRACCICFEWRQLVTHPLFLYEIK